MTRKEGSKNKPKTTKELLDLLGDAAEKEGLEFAHTLTDKASKTGDDATAQDKSENDISNNTARERFSKLELELEDGEVDTYECGNCGANMGSKLTVCSDCGSQLSW